MHFEILLDSDIKKIGEFSLNETWNLYDPRFGPQSCYDECTVCYQKCGGHYAFLDLNTVICHPIFRSVAESRLNHICNRCHKYCPDKICCSGKIKDQYTIDIQGSVVKKSNGETISMETVRKILKDDPDLHRYTLQYILVPPTRTRDSRDPEFMSDLTKRYSDLIIAIKQKKYNTIYSMYHKILGQKRSDGISKFLSGKEGIFRNISLGKRVEKSARSVVTGDPHVNPCEIMIPDHIASGILVPIKVTRYNYKKIVLSTYPIFFRGQPVDRKLIFIGQIYERSMISGDIVLINRQPSLTYSSLLGFTVKIHPDKNIKSISINPIVTPFFNADFDGDEMNIFYFPDITHEILEILHVSKQDIPIPIQDTVTGLYILSRDRYTKCFHPSEPFLGKTIGEFLENLPEQITKQQVCEIIKRIDMPKLQVLHEFQKISLRYLEYSGLTTSWRECSGIYQEDYDDISNGLLSMIRSESKGNFMNLVQMGTRVGDQYIGNVLVENTLPYIYSEKTTGCIKSSYSKGLNPQEFFIHQMAAREGIINTGVSTASTGYLNRRTSKLMANITVLYNNTIGDKKHTYIF